MTVSFEKRVTYKDITQQQPKPVFSFMKRKKIYLIIISAILVITAAWFVNSYFNSASYFLSRLPEQYKSYKPLNATIKSAHHQIIPLFVGGRAKFIYQDTTNNILIVARMDVVSPENKNTITTMTYYRLDNKGTLLDTLRNSDDSDDFAVAFNGHLLYDNYYTNYFKSGSLEKQSYIDVNKDLSLDQATLNTILQRLRNDADSMKIDYISTTASNATIYLFSIKGKVKRAFVPEHSNINLDSKYQGDVIQVDPITVYSSEAGNYNWQDPKSFIQIDYFLKQEYNSERSSSFMASAPMTFPENWKGVGYFSLHFTNDILHFKHPIYYFPGPHTGYGKEYYGNEQWGKLDLFMIPHFGFQLLTVGFDKDEIHDLDGCYLVKSI